VKVAEPSAERLVRELDDRLEECERHVLSDDRAHLQADACALGRRRSIRAASIAWTVGGV
jgi:hypothetical protein